MSDISRKQWGVLRGMFNYNANWHFGPTEALEIYPLEKMGLVRVWDTMGGFPAAALTKAGYDLCSERVP